MKIGVLALQGNFREHAAMLRRLGAEPVEVRKPEQLEGLDGLVVPGGESTTFIRLMRLYGLEDAIRRFEQPVLGTCAGLIVLDRDHLGLVDVEVARNAYGPQVNSFEADLDLVGEDTPLRGVFIRAPRLTAAGKASRFWPSSTASRCSSGRAASWSLPSIPSSRTTRACTSSSSSQSGRRALSGHSKWASIKRKKGATDAKRGQLFSKLTRAIIVAARDGGPDPAGNIALQNAIEKAREASMPKDNIDRAIAKGSGTGADAAAYETVTYEGYGPGGVALFLEALTDNRNRTAADVRSAFTKNDGNLGESGSVAWLFERKGVILVDGSADEDELMLTAADAGAEDIEQDESSFRVTTAPEALHAVRAGARGSRLLDRVRRVDDASEDLGRDRRRGHGQKGRAPDGRAGGERRRPGRLLELRHPRTSPRSSRRLTLVTDCYLGSTARLGSCGSSQ